MTERGTSEQQLRLLGWLGVGAMASIVVIGFGIYGDAPVFTDAVPEIREWIDENGQAALAGIWAEAVTDLLFFIPFILGVGLLLDRAVGGDRVLSRLAVFGGLVSVPLLWMDSAIVSPVLIDEAGQVPEGVLVTILKTDAVFTYSILPISLGLFIGAAGLHMVRSGAAARWLGWLGVATAAGLIVSAAWVIDGDPEGSLVALGEVASMPALVWMLGVAVTMIRSRAPERVASEGEVSATRRAAAAS